MAKCFSFKMIFFLPTAFKAYSGEEDAMFGFEATHAQFNWKSDIFGLPIGSFKGCCLPTAGQGEQRRWVRGWLSTISYPTRTREIIVNYLSVDESTWL